MVTLEALVLRKSAKLSKVPAVESEEAKSSNRIYSLTSSCNWFEVEEDDCIARWRYSIFYVKTILIGVPDPVL